MPLQSGTYARLWIFVLRGVTTSKGRDHDNALHALHPAFRRHRKRLRGDGSEQAPWVRRQSLRHIGTASQSSYSGLPGRRLLQRFQNGPGKRQERRPVASHGTGGRCSAATTAPAAARRVRSLRHAGAEPVHRPVRGGVLAESQPLAAYHGKTPLWLKYPAVGPSSPTVASLTATSAACSTVR